MFDVCFQCANESWFWFMTHDSQLIMKEFCYYLYEAKIEICDIYIVFFSIVDDLTQ